jgi:cell division protein FtsI/penicillin-binding protein 2
VRGACGTEHSTQASCSGRYTAERVLRLLLLVSLASVCAATSAPSRAHREADLDSALRRALHGQQGAAIVIDVPSGRVLAQYNIGVAAQTLDYPGSTLKPFILMELLTQRRVRSDELAVCRRPLRIGTREMNCAHPRELTSFDAERALAWSCNSYFAQMALRLSPREVDAALRRAGFDSLTGLAENEGHGQIRAAQSPDHQQLEALGHDRIVVTPLELLAAYRRLALLSRNGAPAESAPVFRGLADSVKFGMASAARPRNGTAAGKTGTAAGRNTPATHGFFVGYAPAEVPEIALVVYLEHGRGMDAAAMARPVLEAWFADGERH